MKSIIEVSEYLPQLSPYLKGELAPDEVLRLESALAKSKILQNELECLRQFYKSHPNAKNAETVVREAWKKIMPKLVVPDTSEENASDQKDNDNKGKVFALPCISGLKKETTALQTIALPIVGKAALLLTGIACGLAGTYLIHSGVLSGHQTELLIETHGTITSNGSPYNHTHLHAIESEKADSALGDLPAKLASLGMDNAIGPGLSSTPASRKKRGKTPHAGSHSPVNRKPSKNKLGVSPANQLENTDSTYNSHSYIQEATPSLESLPQREHVVRNCPFREKVDNLCEILRGVVKDEKALDFLSDFGVYALYASMKGGVSPGIVYRLAAVKSNNGTSLNAKNYNNFFNLTIRPDDVDSEELGAIERSRILVVNGHELVIKSYKNPQESFDDFVKLYGTDVSLYFSIDSPSCSSVPWPTKPKEGKFIRFDDTELIASKLDCVLYMPGKAHQSK